MSRQRRREVDGVVQHGAEVAATGWRLMLLRLRGMTEDPSVLDDGAQDAADRQGHFGHPSLPQV